MTLTAERQHQPDRSTGAGTGGQPGTDRVDPALARAVPAAALPAMPSSHALVPQIAAAAASSIQNPADKGRTAGRASGSRRRSFISTAQGAVLRPGCSPRGDLSSSAAVT
jgi:hypothetical protein